MGSVGGWAVVGAVNYSFIKADVPSKLEMARGITEIIKSNDDLSTTQATISALT